MEMDVSQNIEGLIRDRIAKILFLFACKVRTIFVGRKEFSQLEEEYHRQVRRMSGSENLSFRKVPNDNKFVLYTSWGEVRIIPVEIDSLLEFAVDWMNPL